ncbi:MAG: hypothetical protein ACLGIT_00745 [Gammaproteobacteria bacterium]
MRRAAVCAAVALSGVVGCAPALDWREVRPAGSGVRLMFPCKPVSLTRSVPLAGDVVELTLLACAADGTTYALTHGDVADPARVTSALQALAASAAANVGAQADEGEVWQVRGMTPNPQARRWRLVGRLPDGSAVHEQVLTFTKGTRVFQATVIGTSLPADATAAFFDSVELPS